MTSDRWQILQVAARLVKWVQLGSLGAKWGFGTVQGPPADPAEGEEDTSQPVRYMSWFGFRSAPVIAGGEGIVVAPRGGSSNATVIATDNLGIGPTDLKEGEVAVFDKAGEFAGYIGSCLDITDRRNTEATLKERENRMTTLLASMGEGVIMRDAGGDILMHNAAAERILARFEQEGLASISLRPEIKVELALEARPAIHALLFGLGTDRASDASSLERQPQARIELWRELRVLPRLRRDRHLGRDAAVVARLQRLDPAVDRDRQAVGPNGPALAGRNGVERVRLPKGCWQSSGARHRMFPVRSSGAYKTDGEQARRQGETEGGRSGGRHAPAGHVERRPGCARCGGGIEDSAASA